MKHDQNVDYDQVGRLLDSGNWFSMYIVVSVSYIFDVMVVGMLSLNVSKTATQ